MIHPIRISLIALLAVATAACGGNASSGGSSSSGGGFHVPLIGGRTNNPAPAGITVNSFLWSATLDTLHFMPLDKADPYAGLVETEWYASQGAPDERFKVNVRILDTRLRADGIRVNLYRQIFSEARGWSDADPDIASATQIENAILTRAQQLKISTLE